MGEDDAPVLHWIAHGNAASEEVLKPCTIPLVAC